MRKHYWMLIPLSVLFVLVYVLPNDEPEQMAKPAEADSRVVHQQSHSKSYVTSEQVAKETRSKVASTLDNQEQLARIRERLVDLDDVGLKAYLNGFSETTADLEAYYDDTRWFEFYLSLGYDESDIETLIVLRSQSLSDEYQGEMSEPDPSTPPHSILVEMLASQVIAYFRDESGLSFQQVLDFSVQDIHQSYSVPNETIINFAHLYLIDELEKRLDNYAVVEQEVQLTESSSALTKQFVAYLDSDDEYIHQQKDPVLFSKIDQEEIEHDIESETIE